MTTHSVRSDRPIEADTLALIRSVDVVMKALERDYFLVGATARDILLIHVFGLATGRATRDLDIGFAVRDWDEFETVAAKLVEDARFVREPKIVHRLKKNDHLLDIIPFGGVENPDHTITWPADLDVVMNVAGFQDAFDAAEIVQIASSLAVRVVSLPGLAVLKLFAWDDRGRRDARDAGDLATLLRSYTKAGNEDRLYGAEMDALEATDSRLELAGARLLGRDAQRLIASTTRDRASEILRDPKKKERLIATVAREWSLVDDVSTEAEELLEQFRAGLEGG